MLVRYCSRCIGKKNWTAVLLRLQQHLSLEYLRPCRVVLSMAINRFQSFIGNGEFTSISFWSKILARAAAITEHWIKEYVDPSSLKLRRRLLAVWKFNEKAGMTQPSGFNLITRFYPRVISPVRFAHGDLLHVGRQRFGHHAWIFR